MRPVPGCATIPAAASFRSHGITRRRAPGSRAGSWAALVVGGDDLRGLARHAPRGWPSAASADGPAAAGSLRSTPDSTRVALAQVTAQQCVDESTGTDLPDARAPHRPRCSPRDSGGAREYSTWCTAVISTARTRRAWSGQASAMLPLREPGAGTSAACRRGWRAPRRGPRAARPAAASRPPRCSHPRAPPAPAPAPRRPAQCACRPAQAVFAAQRSLEHQRRGSGAAVRHSGTPGRVTGLRPARCSSSTCSTPCPQATSSASPARPSTVPGRRRRRRDIGRDARLRSSCTGLPCKCRLGDRPRIEGAHLPVDCAALRSSRCGDSALRSFAA